MATECNLHSQQERGRGKERNGGNGTGGRGRGWTGPGQQRGWWGEHEEWLLDREDWRAEDPGAMAGAPPNTLYHPSVAEKHRPRYLPPASGSRQGGLPLASFRALSILLRVPGVQWPVTPNNLTDPPLDQNPRCKLTGLHPPHHSSLTPPSVPVQGPDRLAGTPDREGASEATHLKARAPGKWFSFTYEMFYVCGCTHRQHPPQEQEVTVPCSKHIQ